MRETTAPEIWDRALGALQVQVARSIYDTWLKGTVGLDYHGETFAISVPSAFAIEWIERRMRPLIQRTLCDILKHPVSPEFRVADAGASGPPLFASAAPPEPSTVPATRRRLNPRYTFNTFAVGGCNLQAYDASLAVAQAPGTAYNPLFIHSDVGLGKTHLLHAIAHVSSLQGAVPLLVTSDEYVRDFVTAVRNKEESPFQEKYHTVDALLIDDIQFLAGKEQSEQRFFHLFNMLYEKDCQIVITADQSPESLSKLPRRLASRFQSGLEVEVLPPPSDTRFAILQQKAAEKALSLDDEVLSFLASQEVSSVRALEGRLNKVIAYLSLTQRAPTVEAAKAALAGSFRPASAGALPSQLMSAVADYYNVTLKQVASPSRDASLSHARHVSMYLLSSRANLSPRAITPYVGHRHPKTIQYGIDKIAKDLQSSASLQEEIASLLSSLPLFP